MKDHFNYLIKDRNDMPDITLSDLTFLKLILHFSPTEKGALNNTNWIIASFKLLNSVIE